MGATEKPLPKYRKPPVVEVAVSVYFRPLDGLKTAHYGRFWERTEKDYPKTQDQPPIMEVVPAEFIDMPPLRRAFLVSADETYIIQLQPSLFGHNWRKVKDTDEYPSFEHAKRLFLEKWHLFLDFAKSENIGRPELTRYELTYVNHLVEEPGSFPRAVIEYSPLITLRAAEPEHFLPDPKVLGADLQFGMPKDRGTLGVSFKQGTRADKLDIMQLQLTARCSAKPDGSDLEDWLEIAHEWIVRGFTDLTSEKAHKKWERIQ